MAGHSQDIGLLLLGVLRVVVGFATLESVITDAGYAAIRDVVGNRRPVIRDVGNR